jgi:hypothetical protein
MKQLRARNGHEQPATKPPWFLVQQTLLIQRIVQKFETPRGGVDCDGDADAVSWADTQCKPCQTGPDRRSISGSQRFGNARVAIAERFRIIRPEVCTQSNEKSMENTVKQKKER